MIPLYDEHREPRRLYPAVTLVLLTINVVVFLYTHLGVAPEDLQRLFTAYGVVPYRIVTGTNEPPYSPEPLYLTLLTAMFLHGGWLHIGGNMLYLWIFGDNVESAMGHVRYLAFYLIAGVGASFAQIAVDPLSRTPAVGASGAIAGVLAAYMLYYPRARIQALIFLIPFITITSVSALLLIGLWIAFQVLSGLADLGGGEMGGVAYFAHIGGFVVGLLLANLFRAQPAQRWR